MTSRRTDCASYSSGSGTQGPRPKAPSWETPWSRCKRRWRHRRSTRSSSRHCPPGSRDGSDKILLTAPPGGSTCRSRRSRPPTTRCRRRPRRWRRHHRQLRRAPRERVVDGRKRVQDRRVGRDQHRKLGEGRGRRRHASVRDAARLARRGGRRTRPRDRKRCRERVPREGQGLVQVRGDHGARTSTSPPPRTEDCSRIPAVAFIAGVMTAERSGEAPIGSVDADGPRPPRQPRRRRNPLIKRLRAACLTRRPRVRRLGSDLGQRRSRRRAPWACSRSAIWRRSAPRWRASSRWTRCSTGVGLAARRVPGEDRCETRWISPRR